MFCTYIYHKVVKKIRDNIMKWQSNTPLFLPKNYLFMQSNFYVVLSLFPEFCQQYKKMPTFIFEDFGVTLS